MPMVFYRFKDFFITSMILTCLLTVNRPAQASPQLLAPATEVKIIRNGKTLHQPSAIVALRVAQDGDIIELGSGTHQGPLTLEQPNLTVRAKAGVLARVNGNDTTWKPAWEPATEYGPYAWQSAINFSPVTMSIDQRTMIHAIQSRGGLTVHANGAGRGSRMPLRSVFTYLASSQKVIVSFASEIDPRKHVIEAARQGTSAITISANGCAVQNIIANGGEAAILLTNTADSVVEHCLAYAADAGIRLGQGATRCKVLHCDVTWNQDAVSIDCDPQTGLAGDDVWITHKRFGTYDKWGIDIDRAGPDNIVAYNYVYDVWNGIQNGNGVSKDQVAAHYRDHIFKGISKHNVGLKVHHNRVDLTMDDALEPGNELMDNQWYSNIVTRARCAARLKTIEMGPFYFFDNVLLQCSDGLRLYKSAPRQATVYVFNNVVDHPNCIIYHNVDDVAWSDPWLRKNLKRGTPSFDLFNNLFLCQQPFTNQAGSQTTPNFKSDFNCYTSSHNPAMILRGFDQHSIFRAQPQFVDTANGNYQLTPNSIGNQQGTAINQRLAHQVTLPFSETQHPNMGRLNIDANQTPHGPTSGLWEACEKTLNLGERDITYYRQQPRRWINTNKQKYRISEHSDDKPILVELTSSQRSSQTRYTITLTDKQGKQLTSKQGPTTSGKASVQLSIPADAQLPLWITLHDDSTLDWQVTVPSQNATLGVDASQTLHLRKYDGGAYRFTHRVTASNAMPFTIEFTPRYSGQCIMTMTDPQGKTRNLTHSELIDPQDMRGLYLFDLSFTKKADIRFESADAYLGLPSHQPIAEPKPRWGKPSF